MYFTTKLTPYVSSLHAARVVFVFGGGGGDASRGNLLSEGSWETAASQSHET